jgi:hypothetical protein
MGELFDLSDSPPSDRLSEDVLEWLARSFETIEEWKAIAGNVFFSANGDSNLARNRVASLVRSHFIESSPGPEDVKRWSLAGQAIETMVVTPPKISASNAAYVDWLYVADYLLLACACPSEQMDEENQRRETDFQIVWSSYGIRLIVHAAREELQLAPRVEDEKLLESVRSRHPKASLANVKEARRLEKSGAALSPPRAPTRAEPLRPYESLLFGTPRGSTKSLEFEGE